MIKDFPYYIYNCPKGHKSIGKVDFNGSDTNYVLCHVCECKYYEKDYMEEKQMKQKKMAKDIEVKEVEQVLEELDATIKKQKSFKELNQKVNRRKRK
jgi:hypothetical protein